MASRSRVASDARFVSENSKHVRINRNECSRFAQMLFEKVSSGEYRSVNWSEDNPLHPRPTQANVVDWIFVADSLNFSFWPNEGEHFTIEGQVGYWALCAAMNRALGGGVNITSPAFYRDITEEQAKRIFKTDQEGLEIPLLSERISILRHNGKVLCEKFGSTFETVIRQANGNAQNLLDLVCENFPSFLDEAEFNGRTVRILKRCQILVADIWGCFEGKNLGYFSDIDTLTMFADYRIPQALHFFGVLEYSPELLELLHKNQLIKNTSPEEVEIRANSIHAVELIRDHLLELSQANGLPVPNSIELDFYIWGWRRDNAEEIGLKSPYHKVRCIYY